MLWGTGGFVVAGRNQFASDLVVEVFCLIKQLWFSFNCVLIRRIRLLIINLSRNPHRSIFNLMFWYVLSSTLILFVCDLFTVFCWCAVLHRDREASMPMKHWRDVETEPMDGFPLMNQRRENRHSQPSAFSSIQWKTFNPCKIHKCYKILRSG